MKNNIQTMPPKTPYKSVTAPPNFSFSPNRPEKTANPAKAG
jgi:hypothetical protein